jgi:hypothetical protein
LYRQMLDVLSIKDAQKLIPLPEDMRPKDPVTENQDALMLKPMKAFQYQDHKAHIAVHTMAMQDPMIMQLLQSNPQAGQMQAAMQAHIAEHLGMQYRIEIEKRLGIQLPAQYDEAGEEVEIDPALEAKLAPLLAQAAQQVLQQNQAQVAAQQAQQIAQDPMFQLQQQEVAIKAAEQQRKTQKDQTDAQLKAAQIAVENKRIDTQAKNEMLKTAAEMRDDREKMVMKEVLDVMKPNKPKKGD